MQHVFLPTYNSSFTSLCGCIPVLSEETFSHDFDYICMLKVIRQLIKVIQSARQGFEEFNCDSLESSQCLFVKAGLSQYRCFRASSHCATSVVRLNNWWHQHLQKSGVEFGFGLYFSSVYCHREADPDQNTSHSAFMDWLCCFVIWIYIIDPLGVVRPCSVPSVPMQPGTHSSSITTLIFAPGHWPMDGGAAVWVSDTLRGMFFGDINSVRCCLSRVFMEINHACLTNKRRGAAPSS